MGASLEGGLSESSYAGLPSFARYVHHSRYVARAGRLGTPTPRVNVRFGSLADIGQPIRDVRFAPESRHVRRRNRCLLCAISGHWLSTTYRIVEWAGSRTPQHDGSIDLVAVRHCPIGVLNAPRTAGISRRDRAEPPGVVVVNCLADLGLAVHHKRPVTDNWLVDRLAGQHQQD